MATESPNRPGCDGQHQSKPGISLGCPLRTGHRSCRADPDPIPLPWQSQWCQRDWDLLLPAGPAAPPHPHLVCSDHQVTLPNNCREWFCPPSFRGVLGFLLSLQVFHQVYERNPSCAAEFQSHAGQGSAVISVLQPHSLRKLFVEMLSSSKSMCSYCLP